LTVADTDVGSAVGQSLLPPLTASQIENLKKYVVPEEPPKRLPEELVSLPW